MILVIEKKVKDKDLKVVYYDGDHFEYHPKNRTIHTSNNHIINLKEDEEAEILNENGKIIFRLTYVDAHYKQMID